MLVDELAAQLGRSLGARYTIGSEIGRGGMAIVYRAHDRQLGREVAIKVMRPEIAKLLGADRFVREIRIESKLQHPHIVALYESGLADTILYYVMPFVDGESLRDRIQREKQLAISEAIRIAREVAAALQYAHTQGVIHRDIKPENILLTEGHAMVADFGIARAVSEAGSDRLTSSGVTVGTPPYMSPEQAGGEKHLDGRSDIYSLGCVLFEMLAGEPPFTGPSQQAIIARHMAERPPSLAVVRPTISPVLEEILETALAKVPADRFSSAAAFVEALAAIEHSGPYRPPRTGRSGRRRAIAAAAIVVTAGAAITALLVKPGARGLEANRVVVFPLEERGLAPPNSGAGYDVALMLGAALEHTDPLKWIDGSRHVDQGLGSEAGAITHRMARSIARERLARYFVEGVVRQDAESTAVTLRLHDTEADSIIAQETAAGALGSPPYRLGLAAAGRLLPRLLAPGRRVDFTPLLDRSPAAIALMLQGEREYRNAHFLPALRFYQRAVQEDTALAFAAVKGALAANWLQFVPDTRAMLADALRREDLLAPRYREFARGLEAYLLGQSDTAVARYERALAMAPEWEEAWMALGDAYYHLMPSRAPLDSLAHASFNRALEADSAFTPPMIHLVEIAVRRGDMSRARALLDRLHRGATDTSLLRQLDLITGCAGARPGRFDWASGRGNLVAVLYAAKHLATAGANADCGEAGFRSLLSVAEAPAGLRWAALVGLSSVLAARGRTAEVAAMVDSAAASGTSQAVWLYVLDMEAGLAVHQQAARMEAMARERFGDAYRGASPPTLWMLATWFARLRQVGKVRALQSALSGYAADAGARTARLLAAAAAGQLAFAEGDTVAALAALTVLRPTAPHDSLQWSLWEPLAVERLKLAELLLAAGDFAGAHSVAEVFDHQQPIAFVPFVPASLAIRFRAAVAMANPELASRHRGRLARLGRSELIDRR